MTKVTKKILCLRHLGHETFWKILHDAAQLPTHPADILRGQKIVLLTVGSVEDVESLFAQAITDLGGIVLPLRLDTEPDSGAALADIALLHAQGATICVCCGLRHTVLEAFAEAVPMAVLNGVSDSTQPVALMGDLTLMRSFMPAMDTMRIAWVGGATPLAHGLIEASMYVPYELFMALPEWGEPDRTALGLALHSGAKIFLTREVHLAVDGAHFVYVGAGPALSPPPSPADSSALGQTLHNMPVGMRVDEKVMAMAAPHAHILQGQALTAACHASQALLEGPSALCHQQKAYSLRVAKSLLTWFMDIQ